MLPVSDFNYKTEKKEKINFFGKIKLKILVVFSVVLSLLFASQLVFASNLVTDGQKLHEIEVEIDKLETENLNLKVQIAQTSSFVSLYEKAQSLGFKQPTTIISP